MPSYVYARACNHRYSTYFVVFGVVRGILSGIIRMVMMMVWIVIQIGVIHRSNFPEGKASPCMPAPSTLCRGKGPKGADRGREFSDSNPI